jgi:hypothetical protein
VKEKIGNPTAGCWAAGASKSATKREGLAQTEWYMSVARLRSRVIVHASLPPPEASFGPAILPDEWMRSVISG